MSDCVHNKSSYRKNSGKHNNECNICKMFASFALTIRNTLIKFLNIISGKVKSEENCDYAPLKIKSYLLFKLSENAATN